MSDSAVVAFSDCGSLTIIWSCLAKPIKSEQVDNRIWVNPDKLKHIWGIGGFPRFGDDNGEGGEGGWPSFRISYKIQLHNLYETSAAKCWINSSFEISPELRPLCSKSGQKLSFLTKPQFPNLQQTIANKILIINISNSNNVNKFWVGIVTRQDHINQVY